MGIDHSTYMYNVKSETNEERVNAVLAPVDRGMSVQYIMDAFRFYSIDTWSGPLLAKMARSGKLKDITELLQEYAPNVCRRLSEEDLKAASVDGRLFAVPSLYPVEYRVCALVREDLKKRYGIPDIRTLEDYDFYLRTIGEYEEGIIPGAICGSVMEIFPHCYGYAVLDHSSYMIYDPNDPEMRVIPVERAEGFSEYLRMLCGWNSGGFTDTKRNYVSGSSINISQTLFSYITRGDVSSYLLPEARMDGRTEMVVEELNRVLKANVKDQNAELKAYTLYPENKSWRVSPLGDQFSGGCMAFNEFSPNVERALKFINWVYEEQENYDLFMYGINDDHYIAEGDIFKLPLNTSYFANSYIGWQGSSALRNRDFERFFTAAPQEDRESYVNRLSNSSYAPHEGFYADYNQVERELRERQSIFRMDIDGYSATGRFKPESIQRIAESLKFSGADMVADEIQIQLDAWRAGLDR